MPRYYFDLRVGKAFFGDSEEWDLLDIADAQIQAAEFLADLARDLSFRNTEPAGDRR